MKRIINTVGVVLASATFAAGCGQAEGAYSKLGQAFGDAIGHIGEYCVTHSPEARLRAANGIAAYAIARAETIDSEHIAPSDRAQTYRAEQFRDDFPDSGWLEANLSVCDPLPGSI